MDLLLAVAAQQDRFLPHTRHKKIAGLGNLAFVADEEPGAGKDLLQLLCIDGLVHKDLTADLPAGHIHHAGRITLCLCSRHGDLLLHTASSACTAGSPPASRCQLSPSSWLANSSGPAAANMVPASSTASCRTIMSNCGGRPCPRRTQCSPPSSLRYRAASAPWRQLGGGPAAAAV